MNYKIFSILIITLALSFSIVYSDTNGIWNSPEDTLGGVFGADEQARTFNYTFINPVHFNETVSFRTFFGFGGFENPQTEVDIDGRWFVRSHGTAPTTGAGMFGSYNPSVSGGVGIVQAYDYDNGVAKNLILQSAGGNVGIGVTNPTEKLEIAGNIKANDIIVNNLQLPGGDLEALYVNEGQANSIDSSMVLDNSLTANDLAANSVGSSELQSPYSSGSAYDSRFINVGESGDSIQDNTIDGSEIQDGSLTANDINVNSIQRRVGSSCGSGYSIRVIRSDGSVVCERDDQGLSGSLSAQRRIAGGSHYGYDEIRFCIGSTCSNWVKTGVNHDYSP